MRALFSGWPLGAPPPPTGAFVAMVTLLISVGLEFLRQYARVMALQVKINRSEKKLVKVLR